MVPGEPEAGPVVGGGGAREVVVGPSVDGLRGLLGDALLEGGAEKGVHLVERATSGDEREGVEALPAVAAGVVAAIRVHLEHERLVETRGEGEVAKKTNELGGAEAGEEALGQGRGGR